MAKEVMIFAQTAHPCADRIECLTNQIVGPEHVVLLQSVSQYVFRAGHIVCTSRIRDVEW